MTTILLIEDDTDLLNGLTNQLKQDQFNVLTASDGQTGLKLALENHPDLILLDYFIPKMDGLALLTQLRDNDWGKSVPVIMLTSLTDNEQTIAAQHMGVVDFLRKPDWTFADISKRVQKRLSSTSS